MTHIRMVKCTTRQQQRRSFIDNIPGQLGNPVPEWSTGLNCSKK